MIFALSLIVLCALAGQTQERESSSVSADGVVGDETRRWGRVVTDPDETAALGADEYELKAAAITGDTLAVVVSYVGGCEDHLFTLDASGAFMESDPVQLSVALAHHVNGGPASEVCTAYITERYFFQLAPLKTQYREQYQQDAGAIVLLFEGAPISLIYEFAHADGTTAVEDVTWARIKSYSRDE